MWSRVRVSSLTMLGGERFIDVIDFMLISFMIIRSVMMMKVDSCVSKRERRVFQPPSAVCYNIITDSFIARQIYFEWERAELMSIRS